MYDYIQHLRLDREAADGKCRATSGEKSYFCLSIRSEWCAGRCYPESPIRAEILIANNGHCFNYAGTDTSGHGKEARRL